MPRPPTSQTPRSIHLKGHGGDRGSETRIVCLGSCCGSLFVFSWLLPMGKVRGRLGGMYYVVCLLLLSEVLMD